MARSDSDTPKVLVVGDDAPVRSALREILAGEGIEALPVGDGEAALEAARHRPPAAILLDLALPGRSGIDLLPDTTTG